MRHHRFNRVHVVERVVEYTKTSGRVLRLLPPDTSQWLRIRFRVVVQHNMLITEKMSKWLE